MMVRVCSYNMGSTSEDYQLLREYADPSFRLDRDDAAGKAAHEAKFLSVQTTASQSLVGRAEVFCLQEMNGKNRPLIESLERLKFQVVHANLKRPYCAIVLSTEFGNIENRSGIIDGVKDFALVVATHLPSNKRIAFASIHVPGCSLEKAVTEGTAEEGDRHCESVLAEISKIKDVSLYFIGADINVDEEKWAHRFQLFQQGGFTTLRTHRITNVFPNSEHFREKEIDYMFFREIHKFGFLPSFCKREPEVTLDADQDCPVTFNPETNASDHIPIFATIRI